MSTDLRKLLFMIYLRENRTLTVGQIFLTDDRTMFCLRHPVSKATLATGNNFMLSDCKFIIDKPLQKQFHKSKAMTTHAWVEGKYTGETDRMPLPDSAVPVRYNPYQYSTFVGPSEQALETAPIIYCQEGKLYGMLEPEDQQEGDRD